MAVETVSVRSCEQLTLPSGLNSNPDTGSAKASMSETLTCRFRQYA
jgi:hypothetical protein